jgi:hypothetical protein
MSSAAGMHFPYIARRRIRCSEGDFAYSRRSTRVHPQADDRPLSLRYLRLMRLPRPHPVDVLIAALCCAAMIAEAAIGPEGGGSFNLLAVPLGLLAAAPLAWRRQAPIAVLLCCVPGLVSFVAVVGAAETTMATAMVSLYTVAVMGDRRRSLLIAAVAAVFLGGLIWVLAHHD